MKRWLITVVVGLALAAGETLAAPDVHPAPAPAASQHPADVDPPYLDHSMDTLVVEPTHSIITLTTLTPPNWGQENNSELTEGDEELADGEGRYALTEIP